MTHPAIPPLYDVNDLELASQCIFHLRCADQNLTALTGHAATFSRAATASIVDSNNVAFTAAQHQPAWEPRDWDADGTSSREEMGLLLGTSDRLTYECDWRPKAFAFWIEFIQVGGMPASGVPLFTITNDTPNGAQFNLQSSSAFWQVVHDNTDGSAVTATLAAAPASGNRVILRGQAYTDGSVQLWQSINGATETFTAQTGVNTFASTWGSGTAKIRIGGRGTAAYGALWLKCLKLVPGIPSYTTLSRVL